MKHLLRTLAAMSLAGAFGAWVTAGAEPEQFIVLNAVPASDFDQIGREFTNSPGARLQVGVAAQVQG